MEELFNGPIDSNTLPRIAQKRLDARRAVLSGDLVRNQVFLRVRSAYHGATLKGFGEACMGTLRSAPLMDPPIPTGMTATVQRMHDILLRRNGVLKEELKEIPGLLKRLKELLRVYYNARVTGKKSPEFKFCDVQDIADVGLLLHEIGVFLQLSPVRLRILLETAPETEKFILEEPIDVGPFREATARAKDLIEAGREVEQEEKDAVFDHYDEADNDQAAFQMAFLLGDVLVAFVLNPVKDAKDKQRYQKAMKRLVEWSTSKLYRAALGDALTAAMIPLYRNRAAFIKFCQAGGLGSFIGDWVESFISESVCEEVVQTLPDQVWIGQTPASLAAVTRELARKVEFAGDEIAATPVFANMMHQMYSRYGLAPFEAASSVPGDAVIFYFIYRRLSNGKRQQKVKNVKDWMHLLEKYKNVPRATRQRHSWSVMSLPARWECIDLFGCEYKNCPEKAALLEIQQARKKGTRDPVLEDRLFRWGAEARICSSCKYVSYCGRDCQTADWQNHKAKCKEETAKGKDEEI